MKTLDEVIDDFEKACDLERRCENCSGCLGQENGCPNDGAESVPDALHYLTEYRTLQYGFIKAMADLEDNPPLTMKEFSRMIDTEPIWCQELQEWYLFLAYDDGDNCIQLMTDKGDIETFDESDLEKYPLYRRK